MCMWYAKHAAFSRIRAISGFILTNYIRANINTLLRRVFLCRFSVKFFSRIAVSYDTFLKKGLSATFTCVLHRFFFCLVVLHSDYYFLSQLQNCSSHSHLTIFRDAACLLYLGSRYGFTALRRRGSHLARKKEASWDQVLEATIKADHVWHSKRGALTVRPTFRIQLRLRWKPLFRDKAFLFRFRTFQIFFPAEDITCACLSGVARATKASRQCACVSVAAILFFDLPPLPCVSICMHARVCLLRVCELLLRACVYHPIEGLVHSSLYINKKNTTYLYS